MELGGNKPIPKLLDNPSIEDDVYKPKNEGNEHDVLLFFFHLPSPYSERSATRNFGHNHFLWQFCVLSPLSPQLASVQRGSLDFDISIRQAHQVNAIGQSERRGRW